MSSVQPKRIELEVPALHPAQRQIVNGAKRFNVLACGRRFGKTLLGIQLCMEPALNGFPVGWFSPTYKMLTEVWQETRNILQPITARPVVSEHRLELITGGVIDMWSLDRADSVRGRKYKRVVVDEAAMIPDFQNAWQAVITPTLMDYEGDGFWLSTPRGFNFFKQGFDYGQDPLVPDWASWRYPSSANPWMPAKEIEFQRQSLPEDIFNQEYLAEFRRNEGAVFRNVEANLVDEFDKDKKKIERPEMHKGHKVVSGLDWGQKHDFTAHSIICETCKKELELDRFNKIDWAFQRERLKTGIQRWGISDVLAEENSIGSPNLEALQDEDLPVRAFTTTTITKGQAIQSLALAFERNECQWIKNPVATNELLAYESKASAVTGRITYSAPEGMHDDTVMARALAWFSISSPQRKILYA